MARITLKSLSKRTEKIFVLPYSALAEEEGFQPSNRILEDLDELAQSIAATGQKQPMKVRMGPDGKAYIIDGHRRYRAIRIAVDKHGADPVILKNIRVFEAEPGSNEQSRATDVIAMNLSKPLEALSQAEVFKRLIDYGMPITDIARAAGKPQSYVRQVLTLNSAPIEIRNAVKDGTLSTSAAIELAKADPKIQKKVLSKAKGTATKEDVTPSGKDRKTSKAASSKPKKRIKVKDVQTAVRGTPDVISSKQMKDIKKKVSALKEKTNKSLGDYWDAVLFGIDLCLGEQQLDEGAYEEYLIK